MWIYNWPAHIPLGAPEGNKALPPLHLGFLLYSVDPSFLSPLSILPLDQLSSVPLYSSTTSPSSLSNPLSTPFSIVPLKLAGVDGKGSGSLPRWAVPPLNIQPINIAIKTDFKS